MAKADQIKALICSHGEGDDSRFYAIAMQVAAQAARNGNGKFAQELRKVVDEAKMRAETLRKVVDKAKMRAETLEAGPGPKAFRLSLEELTILHEALKYRNKHEHHDTPYQLAKRLALALDLQSFLASENELRR
jgi:membrane-bound lytic murein transglycosylase B